ncbi:conserved hypothetical protein [Vibrio aestuarianus]|uniref:hypothetical protein n=1 Tax=Vibrio aestuarianus TaxID=28171 RepID=UPI00145607B5|nr:hypothetical protein [Vibrio aestuarianus]NLS56641.1 hypothetical protein [Vibrio aestuarianus subsp. francensis]NLS63617.1 hypothetical protein [Vibrio aestuarianus subsp. francensis]CAH8188960.1 conserved hypothetical protein [Vibrio aestuarianus]CAH8233367.1 conserved hypothetical protein [Vibrio aestuarianus]
MNFNLPSRKIVYKTGIMMVNRLDEPLYQCRSCYKPFFDDEVIVGNFLTHIECPHCGNALRKITESEPLITK